MSKIIISQSEMVEIVQSYVAKRLFRPKNCPVVTIVEQIDAHTGDFEVTLDPKPAEKSPMTGFTAEQTAMIAKTADVPVTLK